MAVYEYEHQKKACEIGKIFEIEHPISDDALKTCPECGGAIVRLISRTYISSPQTNGQLRDMGFTKLEKRDDGVYENMTRRGSDKRYMNKGDAESMPDLRKTISD